MSVGIAQIALMTLSDHVVAYGHVEPAPGATDQPVDPARLLVEGNVPADDAAALRLGRPVDIATNVANSRVTGKLLTIAPRIDERTDSVPVRVSLPANAGFLAGQFVKLSIATTEHPNVMAIPIESLVKDPDIGYVVCILDGDIGTQKPVRVGIRDGDFVEVEGEGIKVGLTVATSGAYATPKQGKVRVITPTD